MLAVREAPEAPFRLQSSLCRPGVVGGGLRGAGAARLAAAYRARCRSIRAAGGGLGTRPARWRCTLHDFGRGSEPMDLAGLGALGLVAAEWLALGWLSGVAFPTQT